MLYVEVSLYEARRERDEQRYAAEMFKLGSSGSGGGWWDSKMLEQVLEKAIPISEKAYTNHIALFAFDNSSCHACKTDAALVANRTDLGPNSICAPLPLQMVECRIWSISIMTGSGEVLPQESLKVLQG